MMNTSSARNLLVAISFIVCLFSGASTTSAESPPELPLPPAPDKEPTPGLKIHWQTQFVTQKTEAANHVIKSMDDLLKARMDPADAAKSKLDKVDFEKQMVVVIESGMTNSFGVQLSILDASATVGGDAVLHWQFKPYFGGAAPPDQPGNPTLVVVLDRHDGEVKFTRRNWQWPKDLPPPPSAPPGSGPGPGAPRLESKIPPP